LFTRNEEGEFVQATSEGGDVTEVSFVDDCLLAVAVAKAQLREGENFAPIAVSRSGGQYAPISA